MIVCIVGDTGSGKDYLATLLKERNPKLAVDEKILYTTRPKRAGESEEFYNFVTKSELSKIPRYNIIERNIYKTAHDEWIYASVYDAKKLDIYQNKWVVVPCTLEQALRYRNFFDKKNVTVSIIYAYTPDVYRIPRLIQRDSDMKEIQRRIISDRNRFDYSKYKKDINFVAYMVQDNPIFKMVTEDMTLTEEELYLTFFG